ncbi:MAG: hypothetical protein JWO86_3647 [Myxococcaceae bacterium]|nr:hypothetical protein [Myxococcaceae bacterium]MEA2746162.1 hypothetical protein [Myxococcales bacterium]
MASFTWARGTHALEFGSLTIHPYFRAGASLGGRYTPWSMHRSVVALVAVALLSFAAGCVKVAPYERGMLAHPTMTAEEISIGLDGHVRAVSEGAAGGLGGGGGGCGCN